MSFRKSDQRSDEESRIKLGDFSSIFFIFIIFINKINFLKESIYYKRDRMSQLNIQCYKIKELNFKQNNLIFLLNLRNRLAKNQNQS